MKLAEKHFKCNEKRPNLLLDSVKFFAGMSVVLFERKRFILNNEVGSNGLSRNPFEVGQKYSIICP